MSTEKEYGLIGPFKSIPKEQIYCTHIHDKNPFGVFINGESPHESSFSLLLLELSLVLVVTHVIRHLLKPLKQPRVISEILGGIVVGPSCLGRSKKFMNWMFPGQSAFIFRNLGSFAFMYFMFLSGVKMDLLTIKRATKKQWHIAIFGMVIPVGATLAVALLVRNSLEGEMKKISSIWGVGASLAITSFPVLHSIIRELNLLSSDIGRMALATAVIGDVVGINGVVAFEAAKQGEGRPLAPIGYILSMIIMSITIFGGTRMLMFWIIKVTPEGKPVEQFYIVSILTGVLVSAFLSDMLGVALVNGPFWLGLAVPDGPPLGATLVQKCESFISEILMPFAYANVGLMTDVFAMTAHWSKLQPLFLVALTGYLTKLVSTLFITRFFEIPLRDGITLSLIMGLRGEVELLLFIHWLDFQMIGIPQFTMFVLLTMVITGVATPLISIAYNPNRPYMINKRRNIQHTPPNTELRILVCFLEEESVPGLTYLLDAFNPTVHSPFMVYALHLVELVGRAAPVFINHSEEDNDHHEKSDMDDTGTTHKAFHGIQETRSDVIKIHSFTSVAPNRSMYQDVCELALDKKSSLIILPFNTSPLRGLAGTDMIQNNVRSLNYTVLDHAPCSVAVLVDKGDFRASVGNLRVSVTNLQYHFAMLFLGGSDAREALACADRMAGNPNASLTVIRFLAYNGEGDDEMEKKLDDGLVTAFWVKYEGNEQVAYREVVVRNGEETVAAIRAMNSEYYDLWIVGRKLGINPVLIEGLSSWSESQELGVIGDYVASVDLGSSASVLVVQQQVLRDKESKSGGLRGRISRYFSDCVWF
ncbi:cation/H(+) antiporter 24-like [Cynara cardunculus var. scolymus]|uniref:Cation/H+ exchanger n=1 Tax=Cynara cardunculus var. scolymus TaxID=59895 RepID=A0A118K6W1_CYNCS|nr:cation/H(+) antiporter 24-like [Cynara cardunculus var. scolymus]KVI11296.1 Cation/H+ exchanger [Cynara cardunculus var. scolymus]